jgi:YaiO family outer membrane protein
MLVHLASVLVVSMAFQLPPTDRSLAEQLARSGRTVEALDLFEQIVAQDPTDTEARLWIARLQLRLGLTADAEAGFRSVLLEHPSNIDARIGLGAALTRRGAWRAALVVLREAEPHAGENPDLFGALARAYRRAGDDRRALDYYRRGKALAPADLDLVDGFEATAHAYGHSIAIAGLGEGGANGARSVSLTADVRVVPRLKVEVSARTQRRAGSSDALVGGGALFRIDRSTSLGVRAVGGRGNTSLPRSDLTAVVVKYAGVLEVGASIRRLSYADAGVVAASPLVAWDTGRWRLDARYSYSRSSFDVTGETSRDHSAFVRETWRAWRRVDVQVAYAYGIESFEELTSDRLQTLGAKTIAAGLRVRVPSLTFVAGTWEHQKRSNDSTIDRFTLSIVQSFP